MRLPTTATKTEQIHTSSNKKHRHRQHHHPHPYHHHRYHRTTTAEHIKVHDLGCFVTMFVLLYSWLLTQVFSGEFPCVATLAEG